MRVMELSSSNAAPVACTYCGAPLPEGANFCPKCGKETGSKPISLWSAVLAIIVSVFLAPFGLIFAVRYLKRPERVAKWLGISCIVLTAVSIILTLVAAKGFISTYYGSLDSLNSLPYQKMISTIAYFLILGKPVVFWLGIMTLISFLFTAFIGLMNMKGIKIIPFRYHPVMAIISLSLALIHGLLALSAYF